MGHSLPPPLSRHLAGRPDHRIHRRGGRHAFNAPHASLWAIGTGQARSHWLGVPAELIQAAPDVKLLIALKSDVNRNRRGNLCKPPYTTFLTGLCAVQRPSRARTRCKTQKPARTCRAVGKRHHPSGWSHGPNSVPAAAAPPAPTPPGSPGKSCRPGRT